MTRGILSSYQQHHCKHSNQNIISHFSNMPVILAQHLLSSQNFSKFHHFYQLNSITPKTIHSYFSYHILYQIYC